MRALMKKKTTQSARNFRVSVWVSPTYYVPLFFRDRPTSFQWARTQVIPLKHTPNQTESKDKALDDAINIHHDIPASSIDEAIPKSWAVVDFILNIASFHYSIGLTIKSPVSIVDVESGEGISYDFHQLQITKEEFCTKTVQMYLPMNVKDGTGTFRLSSGEILTYEPSEIFKVDDFYQTMDVFKSLYFGYIQNARLREKIGFSLNMLKEAHQIPGFIPRFVLYWRAFEELTNPSVKSGLVSHDSLESIVMVLREQRRPKLSEADVRRVRDQISNIHRKAKTDTVVEELKNYFVDSTESIKLVYGKLNKTRQRIIHSNYTGDDTFELWANTNILKCIVRQIIRVHFGYYSKTGLPELRWNKILHVRDAPKPRIQLRPIKE